MGTGIVINDGNLVSRMGNSVPMSLTKDCHEKNGICETKGNTKTKVNIGILKK